MDYEVALRVTRPSSCDLPPVFSSPRQILSCPLIDDENRLSSPFPCPRIEH